RQAPWTQPADVEQAAASLLDAIRGRTPARVSVLPGAVTRCALLRLPLGSGKRVLRFAVLVAVDVDGPVAMHDTHELQAGFLHHPPRGRIDDHGEREHPLHVVIAEPLCDQGPRPFGRVALAPRRPAQAIA